MMKRQRKTERPVGTRELLLDEAERQLAAKGLDTLTLKDLADPLDIKVPSIYAHFRNRDDILRGIADRYVEALARQFPEMGEDPRAELLTGVRGFITFLAAHPAYVRLKLRDLETPGGQPELSAAAEGEPSENLIAGPLRPLFVRLEKLLKRGYMAGVFRQVSHIELYRLVFGVTLVSLTWPAADILTTHSNPTEVSHIASFVESAVRRFVFVDA